MVNWSAEHLDPWLTEPSRAAVLLDFDGTLSAIVTDPELARPLDGAREVLTALVARYRLVAVISGRPAAFLAAQLPVPGLERWGSYGLERVLDGAVELAEEARPWVPVVASAVARARASAPAGVGVEDKGVSLTLHFRTAPEAEGWVRAFAEQEAAATGLVVEGARMSVELRPPLPVDKGSVVGRLVLDAVVSAACFVGDDRGDVAAFRALDGLPAALRVAVGSDESPPELLAAADVVVEGPAGVLELLSALAG
ncbi:MAG TPA: trehalose-phosphatase [Acidimicrobiales bacterium]